MSNIIAAEIDGSLTSFNKDVSGVSDSVNSVSFTTIKGTTQDGNTISITINGDLKVGTYSSATLPAAEKPIIVYTAGGEEYVNTDLGANAFTLSVTAISDQKVIDGTFSGELTTLASGNTTKTKTFTNGKFGVRLSN